MPSDLADKAILLLSPNIGNANAKSMVFEACKSIDADIETLDNSKLIPFSEQLERSMVPRVGPGIAKKTRDKLIELGEKKIPVEIKVMPETKLDEGIDKEIEAYLEKNTIQTEDDIQEYSKYLTKKYGGDAKSIEHKISDTVNLHVKDSNAKKKVKVEIKLFLNNFPRPTKTDVDDFVRYLRLSKIVIDEAEIREQMENERLFRKFDGGAHSEDVPEADKLMNLVKGSKEKGVNGENMKKQGMTYLIKDESEDSDKSLSEFMEIMTPNENDMKEALKNMGLFHLVPK